MIKMCTSLRVNQQLFFVDFNETLVFSTHFRKILKYESWNFNSGNCLFTTDTK